jgi:hypothetical protein
LVLFYISNLNCFFSSSLYLFIYLLWTQSLTFARQVLCHLGILPPSFVSDRVRDPLDLYLSSS